MNYIEIETNSLVTLVGRYNNKIDWANMGTSADIINLSSNKFAGRVNGKNGLYYVLPINNVEKATTFCSSIFNTYGIIANVLTEEQALIAIQYAQDNPIIEEV